MEFLEYIFREVKANRLEKTQAADLVKEFRQTRQVPASISAIFSAAVSSALTGAQRPDQTDEFHRSFSSRLDAAKRPHRPDHAASDEAAITGFDTLLRDLLFAQLTAMGVFGSEGASIPSRMERSGIQPRHERWLKESLRSLREHGYLTAGDEPTSSAVRRADLDLLWREWRKACSAWHQDAALKAQCQLVEPALQSLQDILRGGRLATDVLFPKASLGQVEAVYAGNPARDYFNDLLASAVGAYLEERTLADPSVRLRVLEIGAGTGSTSARVLDTLQRFKKNVQEYCYTDISRTFLLHAEAKFAAHHPYLRCALFNVEKDPRSQHIAAGEYDIVIAANVLHATRNIRQTLLNTRALLSAKGLLLLNEMTSNSLSLHLTFGLLDGWWLFEDEALRLPGCPALTVEAWREALNQAGFGWTKLPAPEASMLGQQTILAMAADATVADRAAPTADDGAGREKQVRVGVKQSIVTALRQALKVDAETINPEDSFADYGVDSIMGGHVVHLVNRALGLDLSTTVLFDHTSVNRLTAFIMSEFGGRFAQRSQDAEPAASQPPAVQSSRSTPRVEHKENEQDAVAIIGMSGRFAQSANVAELWAHLRDGNDLVARVSRWKLEDGKGSPEHCAYGGLLDGIDEFDPLFFNISGVEAAYTDPQHRLFLEESWRALEDAGYAGPAVRAARCGVYVGCNGSDYAQLLTGQLPAQAMWGNSPAILSARLSYFLDLHGPAITIDTACSSSLVAIHVACQALLASEVDMAVAGGVMVHSTPALFMNAGRASMLSSLGRCFTFDDRADGFVPGEGVGVVVLKRLQRALADGDHIRGVIRGSGINQDGTTNGITAPSARSQEQLLRDVYERFNINPESLQLIEAHGTGTRLGDPIEYEALKNAFGRFTSRKQFCALGAIKTNIGHTLAAAGVASVIKVLLSLQHRQIPPSLNYEVANSHIDFSDGPLYVNTKLQPWNVAPGSARMAGISSFGFSGTNAHLVIAEAPSVERQHAAQPGYLIVLSSRRPDALRSQAQQLIERCKAEPTIDCGNVSYTLLMGRERFAHRLACVARDASNLVSMLQSWLDGDPRSGVFAGRAQEPDELDALRFQEGERCIRACWRATESATYCKQLEAVAELYTQGYELPFAELFDNDEYSRVALPTYPFARGRYWAPGPSEASRSSVPAPSYEIPSQALDLRNESTFSTQRYSVHLTGEEFFVRDHTVQGEKVLPGAVYLEIARAAVARAQDSVDQECNAVRLRDVVWPSPVRLSADGASISISLRMDESDEIHYQISSRDAQTPHSQGSARLIKPVRRRMELDRMRSRCDVTVSSSDLYQTYRAMGIEHGDSMRALGNVSLGRDEEGHRFALTEWQLPGAHCGGKGEYGLHPCVADSAFQTSLALAIGSSDASAGRPLMPFCLEEAVISRSLPECGWIYTRESGDSTDRVCKVDIDICDEAGEVCVAFRGINSRRLDAGEHIAAGDDSARNSATDSGLLLRPIWEPQSAPLGELGPAGNARVLLIASNPEDTNALGALYSDLQVLPADQARTIEEWADGLRESRPDHVIWVAPDVSLVDAEDERLIDEQQRGVLNCFRLIKALFRLGYAERSFGLTVVTRGTQRVDDVPIRPAHASVHGLIGSLAKEQPGWQVRIVDLQIDGLAPWPQLLRLPGDPNGDAWCHRRGEWYRQQLAKCELTETAQPVYRRHGVYVLIGGAGGIGEVLSEHLIRRWNAQVIWIGRRPEDEEIRGRRARLGRLGVEPEYIQADATDRAALERAYAQIKARHEHVHGIVHAAIVLLDRSLRNMDEERFARALAAKVNVSVHLAQVFSQESPDFVMYFSGLQSFGKMPGQSNYAAGCTFKDAHARALSEAWNCPVKVMNWGYWGGVGIVASEEYRARMEQAGIGSIEAEDGIQALQLLLQGPFDQLGFIKVLGSGTQWDLIRGVRETLTVQPWEVSAPAVQVPVTQPREATVDTDDVRRKSAYWQEVDACLADLLLLQLNSMGSHAWDTEAIRPVYRRWHAHSVRELQARLRLGSDRRELSQRATSLDANELWQRWERLRETANAAGELPAHLKLADATLRSLPAILTGEIAATDVMFPRSSMSMVEGVYKNNAVADHFNGALCTWLDGYVRERLSFHPGTKLRLLEIGAGTGGTSAGVFEMLRQHRDCVQEYCYTDISRAFLLHATEHYLSLAPYLKCQLFDVERDPREQSLDVGAYDVVIATNVLHATKNIRQTLRNAKALLRNNGVLLINEITATNLPTHLTFALLEGWWRFEDEALRIEGCPALTVESWQHVLRQEGFRNIVLPAVASAAMGQQIIAAQSDGVVRLLVSSSRPQAQSESIAPEPESPGAHAGMAPQAAAVDTAALKERATLYLRQLVAQTLKIDVNEITPREPLERYGIDSILVVRLTDALKAAIPGITSTVFFEHQTIAALVTHLLSSERAALAALLGFSTTSVEPEIRASAPSVAEREPVKAQQAKAPFARAGIAIIGLSGRYPLASTLQEYWDNLRTGRDCIRQIPAERWALESFYTDSVHEAVAQGKSYGKWGGFIEGFADFDALFFNISPGEAQGLDPQERLFLQSCWEVFEDAGYTREQIQRHHEGRVGVFAGITKTGFDLYGPQLWQQGDRTFPRTSFSSVANRVSYFFNLHGPSMPVDTMCSASLTAIHEACEHILRGDCDLAIAGGVNVYVHPSSYVALSALQMLSPVGRCKSFGAGGDGMVPGEGVGTVLIKGLSAAIADGDHIYGVIRGTSINHGGKTNGYTVPNPQAQRELIQAALTKAGVNARAVTCIEAHGTGTELGDPIEIAGLTQAFERDTTDKQFCAIGSVKSNIGHAESAAGIAGLTKILLQMRHGLLVPTLHADALNPNIAFERTPFVVQRELQPWHRPMLEIDGQLKECPRIAGISSFGAGGSNAHVIVEEYVADVRVAAGSARPVMIVLSAKSGEALREQVARLVDALDAKHDGELPSIAYTLQVGREAMEHRLALLAQSVAELQQKLMGYVQGEAVQDLYRGEVKSDRATVSLFDADDDVPSLIEAWLAKEKYGKVLELWVKGVDVDWRTLYGAAPPARVSLPTYPFNKERHWLPLSSLRSASGASSLSRLHPLLHENASDLDEQRYASHFTGEEFFLASHKLAATSLLPAVAYLEMARESLARGVGTRLPPGARIGLKNVAWQQPLFVDRSRRVYTGLHAAGEEIRVEIYSESDLGERIVHSQGAARWCDCAEDAIDVTALLDRAPRSLSVDQCYEALRGAGLEYGSAMRGLRSLRVGGASSDSRFVLAQIEVPPSASDSGDGFSMHPSLVDAALQASTALWLEEEASASNGAAHVPYALDEMLIVGEPVTRGWAHIAHSDEPADPSMRKVDITLCDDAGAVWLKLRGLSSREVKQSHVQQSHVQTRVLLLEDCWKSLNQAPTAVDAQRFEQRQVVLFETSWQRSKYDAYEAAITGAIDGARCTRLSSAVDDVAGHVEDCALQLLNFVQALIRGNPAGGVLIQVVIDARQTLLSGLSGLLKTARLENPDLKAQLILVNDDVDGPSLAQLLEHAARRADLTEIRQHEESSSFSTIEPVAAAPSAFIPWKEAGVYLISGGTGALGLLLAEAAAAHSASVRLKLIGRRAPEAAVIQRIEQLRSQVEFVKLDVADRAEVDKAVEQIRREHGRIDGVIHCAGVIRDSFLLNKTHTELHEVFAPKVSGIVNLDLATRHDPLDFFVAFSSAAAVFGGIGQADYACANAFMDEYVRDRSRRVQQGQCAGRSLSICWPAWLDGGMKLSQETQARMRDQAGWTALTNAQGLQAFYAALASELSRVVVLALQSEASPERAQLQVSMQEPQYEPSGASSSLSDDELSRRTLRLLKKLLSASLKMEAARIEADVPFEKYGIDSILVMQMTRTLEQTFGSLSKTLFFQYRTLEELGDYFLKSHREALLKSSGAAAPERAIVSRASHRIDAASAIGPRTHSQKLDSSTTRPAAATARTQVAIVGMSGRYAQARNLREFWDNLQDGRDCIEEIPSERWDHRQYFAARKGTFGKSYSKWGGFIPGMEEFDALFFNISPLEADFMDPQERLFLQCAYEALEEAGYTRERLQAQAAGAVGVFVGVMYEEYQLYGAQAQTLGQPVALAGNASSIANRVSYFCNFHGPSLALDTMCSSSLTAIHLACESLVRGECRAALAGGVNVTVHPNKYLSLSQGQFASSKGRCQTFGEGGDGYVPGEGCGALLLKNLQHAIDDGDHIHAVILATSINHGGKTNGYTVPNPQAQARVIEAAIEKAGISAREISYIEAHGTGTSLGDPIEITGLSQAFSRWTADKQFCAIGSAKSNIGHCESAAGVAGVTKILLQMRHGLLAPSLHAQTLNPHIDFENSPFTVQRQPAAWTRPVLESNGRLKEYPRIAGVSAFGAGGSNAHVIVQEYVPDATTATSYGPALIVLSARSEDRLRESAAQLQRALQVGTYTQTDLPSIAYTLQVGREAMERRLALLVESLEDLSDKLDRYLGGEHDAEGLFLGEVQPHKSMVSVFAEDDELQEAIAKWVARGKYGKLLELWTKGVTIDWQRLYANTPPRRISLPTYPFARERHWFTMPQARPASAAVTSAAAAADERPSTRESRLLKAQWRQSPPGREVVATRSAVILATEETRSFAQKLAGSFVRSHIVAVESLDSQAIAWNEFDTWIDVAGCGDRADESIAWLTSLQHWIQSARASNGLAVGVTRRLEDFKNPAVNAAGALHAGLYRMLQNEYRGLRSRHVDTDLELGDEKLIEQIRRECHEMDSIAARVCYRDGQRYVGHLAELELDSSASSESLDFPDSGVLWITGGTQGLGALCAEHFVRHRGVRKLVLSGRTALPPREEWALHGQLDTEQAKKIRRIEALEAFGVAVRVTSVDLTDLAAMRAEVEEIRAELGSIAGVLHCAGVVDLEDPAFIHKSLAGMERVFAPKVRGLTNLIRCVESEPLRFLVLFSSISAAVPSLAVGQSDYAMANACMDHLAQAHRSHLPITSIQWSSWKQTGFGETVTRSFQRLGLLSQSNAEGLAFMDRILAQDLGAVVLPVIVDAARWPGAEALTSHVEEVKAVPASAPAGSPSSLNAAVCDWLRSIVSTALRIEVAKLMNDVPLQDYGVDSVFMLQLLKPVSQAVGRSLDPSILFEHPTIGAFAAWLVRQHADALSRVLFAVPVVQQVPVQSVEVMSAPPASSPASMHRDDDADIAVVGMACRFPGASNLDAYWQLLSQGRSAIAPVPASRGGNGTGWAGLIDNIDQFDSKYFQLADTDTAVIDPQALIVLEESLHTFCHAGIPIDRVKGARIGVYLGGRGKHRPDPADLALARNPILAVGQNYLAANISRFFDLRGPSLVVDTACSSALVAMSLAIQALRSGDIDSALVGGVNLLSVDTDLALFEQRGLQQSGAEFHIFDRRARGAIYAEGAGMVLLKPLSRARRDGDTIYAVVKGIAVNNDGRTVGASAPNVHAQKEVMAAALEKSGLQPLDVAYVDVNGSGSEIPDLLELKAIRAIYRPGDAMSPCELGSMKPNIGHLLCASGIASFIKVVLMLHHGRRVPFLSAQQPNVHYDFESSPLRFGRSLRPWDEPRTVAAINCFADGGTNANIVLQSVPEDVRASPSRQPLPPPTLQRVNIRRAVCADSATVSMDSENAAVSSQKLPLSLAAPPSLWVRVGSTTQSAATSRQAQWSSEDAEAECATDS